MTEPSAQAIEAAAKAIFNETAARAFLKQPDPSIDDLAAAALTAALPLLEAEWRRKVAEEIETADDLAAWEHSGMALAARIVRGGGDE